MSRLENLGEFGWIQIAKRLCPAPAGVRKAIGDDAAVLSWNGKKDMLLTTDMILEDRHFRLTEASPYEIGWKAMAVNLSDIAAMGGLPKTAVVALGAPPRTTVKFLKEIYRGLNAAARRFGVGVAGGDTNASKKWVICVTLLGEVPRGKAVLRSGARPGDWVFVSGTLGGSYVSRKHLRFTPRVEAAMALAKNFRLSAMMDLSDGLASDIRRICEESGVGVVLEEQAIPVSRHAKSVENALCDGEDFELLFTLPPAEGRRLLRKKWPRGFPRFTHIGEITPGRENVRLRRAGRAQSLLVKGFDHFR